MICISAVVEQGTSTGLDAGKQGTSCIVHSNVPSKLYFTTYLVRKFKIRNIIFEFSYCSLGKLL